MEGSNIIYKNTNICLIDKELKCMNTSDNINDDDLITLIPNQLYEELYTNDINIGKILNNSNYFVPIREFCVSKYTYEDCPFNSKYIYFMNKIDYNLKQFYSNNYDLLYIQKLYNKHIIKDKNKILDYKLLTELESVDKLKNKILSVHNLYILIIFRDALIGLEEMQKKRIIHKNIKPSNIYLTLKDIDITEVDINKLLTYCPTTKIGDFKLAVEFNDNTTIDDINRIFKITNYDYRYLCPELYIINRLYSSKLLKFYDFSQYIKLLDLQHDITNCNMDFLNYIKSWNTLTELNHSNIIESFKKNWDKIDIFSLGITFYKVIKNMNKNALFFNDINNLLENMIHMNPEKRYNTKQCLDIINTKIKKIIDTKYLKEKINEYYTPDMFKEVVETDKTEEEIKTELKLKQVQRHIFNRPKFVNPNVENINPEDLLNEDDYIRNRLKNDANINILNVVKGVPNKFGGYNSNSDIDTESEPDDNESTIFYSNDNIDTNIDSLSTNYLISQIHNKEHINKPPINIINNNNENLWGKMLADTELDSSNKYSGGRVNDIEPIKPIKSIESAPESAPESDKEYYNLFVSKNSDESIIEPLTEEYNTNYDSNNLDIEDDNNKNLDISLEADKNSYIEQYNDISQDTTESDKNSDIELPEESLLSSNNLAQETDNETNVDNIFTKMEGGKYTNKPKLYNSRYKFTQLIL